MAIGRITGQMLSANLARSGTDLTFETNLLALDVSNSRVGIGTASPATTLHVSATDALRLPSGTDAQRPGSPANGDIRYNSDQAPIAVPSISPAATFTFDNTTSPVPFGVIVMSPFVTKPVIVDAVFDICVTPN